MKLIDADALKRKIEESGVNGTIANYVKRTLAATLDNEPTVDAAPVVHGRWIQYEPDLHGTKPLECGACHYLFARLYPRDFCPHCGAKMDGGDNHA